MADRKSKSPTSPKQKPNAIPAHKPGPAGKAKTDQRTKIKSASRYEERTAKLSGK